MRKKRSGQTRKSPAENKSRNAGLVREAKIKSSTRRATLSIRSALQILDSSHWVQGIDVSKNQNVDWSRIDVNTIRFAFIKATDGVNYVDPKFNSNWASASKVVGLKRGAYHFFRPDDEVDAQLRCIRQTVALKSTDFPIVVDIENTRNRALTVNDVPAVAGMLKGLTELFTSKPIIYTGNDAWTNLGTPSSHDGLSFGDFPLWIAYYSAGVGPPKYPSPWPQWMFWQYSESGTVGGVTGQVDLDRFNGSLDGALRLAGTV